MKLKAYFLSSFLIGVISASAIIQTLTPAQVHASNVPTTVEEQPAAPFFENIFYLAIYLLLVTSGVIIWKKVEKVKPRYKIQEPISWHSI